MAHFAKIVDGVVVSVIVIDNKIINDAQGESEDKGKRFIESRRGFGEVWVQCSYNGSFRGRYPGKGYRYDSVNDLFIAPQPFPSWTMNKSGEWVPPVPMPNVPSIWDENKKEWSK